MTFRVHVISDLFYGFNEVTESVDNILPEVDLVILNGNISYIAKRSFLYTYELCSKYPHIQFVYNFGFYERYYGFIDKFEGEGEESLRIRKNQPNWPKNLHWKDPKSNDGLLIKLQTNQVVSVWPTFGFPKIHSFTGVWEDTWWYRNIAVESVPMYKFSNRDDRLLEGTELELFSSKPIWASEDWIKQKFEEQESKIRNWEVNLQNYGILVTHTNPYYDEKNKNCVVSSYNIHMANKLWVTTNQSFSVNYLGGKLYANSGRGLVARGEVIEVD